MTKSQVSSDTRESTIDSMDTDHTDTPDSGSREDEIVNATENEAVERKDSDLLITKVYQINILGDQPIKKVSMQIPMRDKEDISDIAIVCADERLLHKEGSLEILQTEPTIVNRNLVFEVSHFCLYVPYDLFADGKDISKGRYYNSLNI